ncbi:MAG: glycosyltransferase [Gammaproteobacteria bacterium]|nr:glycosyltransferase [Gammaproteobacteria bacterium]
MEIIFWFLVLATLYSYFIYPLVLYTLILCTGKSPLLTSEVENYTKPKLTLIITAHNEESRIAEKLKNSLTIRYPHDKLQILVASDCSTDETDTIVQEASAHGVELVRAETRRGKEYAQWLAIKQATGDILIFSDVATNIPEDAFSVISEIFIDRDIGAISSEDKFVTEDNRIVGEGLYVRYEMWLRKIESRLRGVVGLSGSFFAVRRELCENWDILVPSDFNTALNCASLGYVAVSDNRLIGIFKDVKNPKGEYERKVRTIIRGITALSRKLEVLNPAKYGIFSFQVWSHKVMRWLVPWLMLFTFSVNTQLLSKHWFYVLSLIIQICFYVIAICGFLSESSRNRIIVRLPYYFMQANIAIAHATVTFIFGKRVTVWTPSIR